VAIAEMFPVLSPGEVRLRPGLQLVSEGGEVRGPSDARWAEWSDELELRTLRAPRGRRPARRRPRVLWHRLVAMVVVVGVTVLLALPVSALAGRPAVAHGAVAGAPIGGFVYVVQPGDTLWSIARQVDQGGDPQQLVKALSERLGSQVVVPGERIRVP